MKKYKISCPNCAKPLIIEAGRETLTEPIRGEYQDTISVKLDSQTKLPVKDEQKT